MADDQPTKRPDDESGANVGWTAVGYLLAGMAVWGFVGWLVDRWLGWHGIATATGAVLGTAGGIYLIFRKLGG